MPLLKGILCC